jgi:hypothetical protein
MVTANQTSIPSGSLSATRCVVDDCVVDDCAVDGRFLDNLMLSASSRTFETSESFRREYRVLMTPRVYGDDTTFGQPVLIYQERTFYQVEKFPSVLFNQSHNEEY